MGGPGAALLLAGVGQAVKVVVHEKEGAAGPWSDCVSWSPPLSGSRWFILLTLLSPPSYWVHAPEAALGPVSCRNLVLDRRALSGSDSCLNLFKYCFKDPYSRLTDIKVGYFISKGPENPQDFFAPAPVNNSRGASLLRSHERLQ